MAKMIPPVIPDKAPRSEKIIFENLMRAPQARDWVVFHSFEVRQTHSVNPREIDSPSFLFPNIALLSAWR